MENRRPRHGSSQDQGRMSFSSPVTAGQPAKKYRLNQYLAASGLGSRRACDQLVSDGLISVNGKVVSRLATVVSERDQVLCHGKTVRPAPKLSIIVNKPKGFVCSRKADHNIRTVYELLPPPCQNLFYVGRLDADSEGLLLFTNDGDMAQKLAHPKHHVAKIYHATLDKLFDFSKAELLIKGIRLDGKKACFDAIYQVRGTTVKVILSQGLNRQIRRMFFCQGYEVKKLVRVQIGGLAMDTLRPGAYRILNEKDKALLFKKENTKRPEHAAKQKAETPFNDKKITAHEREKYEQKSTFRRPRKF